MALATSGLPIPKWVIGLLFVLGVGVGLVLGFAFSTRKVTPEDLAHMMKRQAAEMATEQPPAAPAEPPPPAQPPADAEPAPAAANVSPKDSRLLANMTAGPVKRALEGSLEKVRPRLIQCRAETEQAAAAPEEVYVRLALEAIGGMATVTEIELMGKSPAERALQACLVKAIGASLVDFPVEDGVYEVIQSFRPGAAAPPAKTPKPAAPAPNAPR
ncbi:MAG: hypothetical protein C4523_11575 [Myxococcales bacterium]|nr:MAG: hypothetical protein C4523_11575 [Myxococcales bacterium]